eukprot:CAMPEP_0194251594 /NCGR_PEP_ID=MMETSP0158-20130606/25710_1 /TAXON_ID=33649 /ORGANISM="Thalassionema nitzschioides, Strain L26-B" /LENGTH=346 /DNA_ID=CAMNT_0038988769 /DNA_START=169 /DNA_END=1209 /DNA_ORIENTATION=-
MFGAPFDDGVQYHARLQYLSSHPYLCHAEENSSTSLSDGGKQPLKNNYNHNNETTNDDLPVALLVRRGVCSFEEKALTAIAMGKKPGFVIVYDDESHSDLIHMGASNRYDIDIHMLFVSYTTGLKLRQMLREQKANLTIEESLFVIMDGQFPDYYIAYNGASGIQEWFLILTSGVLAFLTSIGCFLICAQAGFLAVDSQFAFGLNKGRMTKQQVLKFPTVKYEAGEGKIQQTCCPICIEEYEADEDLRQLPCHHKFHTECIVPWLERHSVCPMCKVEVSNISEEEKSSVSPLLSSSVAVSVLSRLSGRTLVSSEDPDERAENDQVGNMLGNSDILRDTGSDDLQII